MTPTTPFISIVTPVYKAEACVEELCRRLIAALESLSQNFEIILVEDSSPDHSWEAIERVAAKDPRCKGIRLSRNFGQHYALTAGLEVARGEWVVVMDCDLQDQPEEISKLLNAARDGSFDVVFGRRTIRQDSFLKRLSSKVFYTVYNYFTDSDFDNSVANFSIAKLPVIRDFLRLREHNRSYPLFIRWLGFHIGYADIQHAERFSGATSYTLQKLIRFATESIVSQSNKPLHLSIALGLVFASCAFMIALFYTGKYFICGIPVTGWTSMIVSLWFLGGVLLANLGVLGLYLGHVFNEVKNRPLYVVRQTVGFCTPPFPGDPQ